MIIVDKNLEVVDNYNLKLASIPNKIKIILDTEFTQKSSMKVDIVGFYSPQISNYCYCYFSDDLNDDFNPIIEIIKLSGFDINIISLENLQEGLLNEIGLLESDLFREETNAKKLKKLFDNAINSGYFDNVLSSYNLGIENIKYKRIKKISNIFIDLDVVEIELEFFYAIADLFKIFGKNHQHLLLKSNLNQYRVLRFDKAISIYADINNKLVELKIIISDCYYRIQPANDRSLNGNARALGLEQSKIDIKTDEIAREIGLKSGKEVIENFSKFASMKPELSAIYNSQDIFLSDLVSVEQQNLLDKLREDFNIRKIDINDTTGSIVSKFIKDLIYKEFGIEDDYSNEGKILSELFTLTKIKNLQDIPLNDFGIQPFFTVGGLLFSRTAKYPIINGRLSDCDLSSCYATFMSGMYLYLGEPVIRTFKYKKYKPKLRDIIEFIEGQNLPRDAWFIRVSGTLKQAFNTLIMSDLRFINKSVKCPDLNDINPNRKSIEMFNSFKTPKKGCVSTLLLKEIKFGLINADLIDCLKLLPRTWYAEYLDLDCDCVVYYPSELICDSINEVEIKKSQLPDESYTESFDLKNGIKNIQSQYYKNNVSLRFDIGKYWHELKSKRGVYKRAKNPIQEIFKLVGNSGYGVLACLHLATNNLVASNMITAGARSATWLMCNALNGFSPITDGTSFNWNNIPTDRKFTDILESNPYYLFDYDDSIKSNLSDENIKSWLNGVNMSDNFMNHLYSFYEVNKSFIPINRYGYELKDESFNSKNCTFKSVFFSNYYNTNAGNYSKGLDESIILIDAQDYEFESQNNRIKARSFDGYNEILINWYLDCLKNKYISPIIYSENKIIKFSDGNQLAIRLLESGIDNIVHPMGFGTKSFKMMKLISRSQFLFLNESQMKNFETNEHKLAELSNQIFTKSFWNNINNKDLEKYDVKLIETIDYYNFSKSHSVGIGFELLSLSRKHKGSIKSVRNEIFDKILDGSINFNADLNISRSFKYSDNFRYLLAAIIVKKANSEYELIQCLKNSTTEPTLLNLTPDNIRILRKIWYSDDD